MRAVVLDKLGGPDALVLREFDRSAPGPGEAVVRVKGAGVNRLDVWVRNGTYRVPLPHVLGADVVGEMAEDAPSGRLRAGDRVIVYPVLSCGKCPSCRAGRQSLCPTVGILGRERLGGYAEEVVVPESMIVPLPANVAWEKAAALPISYLSAEHALNRAGLRGGETVVVFGASGGLGCALVARAHRRGSRVIAVTGAPQSVPELRILGAEEVLMRGGSDLPHRVLGLTRGAGADVVVDSSGSAVFAAGIKSLARGGRYVSVGVTTGAQTELDLRSIYPRQISVIGSFLGDREEFLTVLQDLARERIDPPIAGVLPLDQASEAHRKLDLPHLGKLVLRP